MDDNPKEIVEQAYDNISQWYLSWIEKQHSPREKYATKVLENGPASPCVLELGCGPGVPITRLLLSRGAEVVANDISKKQIELAKIQCPQATLIQADMMTLSFKPMNFDGVICFFTIFHLPREEQKVMLSKICLWLKPGGLFVCNFATIDEEEIHGEFLGHGMFWSSYGVEDNKTMVIDAGFDVIDVELLEAGNGQLDEGEPDYGVKFMWVTARKRG